MSIVDQRELPGRLVERELRSLDDVCDAIRTLAVRGAPAIGIAGAMGLVSSLAAETSCARDDFLRRVDSHAETICGTRPTAVNLGWALDRVRRCAHAAGGHAGAILDAMHREATAILEEDRAMCRRIGEHGVSLLREDARVLTHCNTGALATGGIGTALAAIYVAAERGLRVAVFVDETRPLLQGSRLTAWELTQARIPATVLVDSAAASLMRAREVDLCIVGADRIATNGDVANKVGTYALAVAARHHNIPFYVAAPTSSFDPRAETGADIRVEQRSPDELRSFAGVPTAPAGVAVHNPAFDVTPAELITAIVSDRGVHRPPYDFRLRA